MSKISFIIPGQAFLLGVDDERDGEMRHIVFVASDVKDPERFTRAFVVASAKAADMQSGTGAITGLTRGLEKEFLDRVQPALQRQRALILGPEPLPVEKVNEPVQAFTPAADEDVLKSALEGGKPS